MRPEISRGLMQVCAGLLHRQRQTPQLGHQIGRALQSPAEPGRGRRSG